MAVTTRADLFVPEVMADAITGALAGVNALGGTGAVAVEPGLPEGARGGDTVNIPYFGHLGEFESRTDGQALTIASLTSSEETATVVRSGKAFEITNWAQRAAGPQDPYAEGVRQITAGVSRQLDTAAIVAANASPLVLDRKNAALAYDHFVDLLDLFGDEQDDVVAFACHSKILASLRKLKDSANRPMLVDMNTSGEPPRILGRPVFVSDKLPVDPDGGGSDPDIPTYRTLALKRASIAIWLNNVPSVETDKDILVDSKVAAINLYYAVHRYIRMPYGTKPGTAVLESRV